MNQMEEVNNLTSSSSSAITTAPSVSSSSSLSSSTSSLSSPTTTPVNKKKRNNKYKGKKSNHGKNNKKIGVINLKKFSTKTTSAMSLTQARTVTSQYHVLNSKIAVLKQNPKLTEITRQEQLEQVEAEIEQLGGHAAYQQASVINTDRFRTSKYVFSTLTKLGLRPKSKEPSLKTLEIGAINLQLKSCFWLNVRAIDLVSQHPDKIEAIDFFDLPRPLNDEGRYQVIVCFMVINYVSTAQLRGDFLLHIAAHLLLQGHLFIALPLRCLDHSRFMNRTWFQIMLESLGLDLIDSRFTPKVAFFTFQKTQLERRKVTKIQLKQKPKKNIPTKQNLKQQKSIDVKALAEFAIDLKFEVEVNVPLGGNSAKRSNILEEKEKISSDSSSTLTTHLHRPHTTTSSTSSSNQNQPTKKRARGIGTAGTSKHSTKTNSKGKKKHKI